MKILVLNGSPHQFGTTATLLKSFVRGAEEAGHEIVRFNTAFLKIHPCTACCRCGCGTNPCVFDDDMSKITPELVSADAVVLATPVYYFSIAAQLKVCMDRFYSVNDILTTQKKKAALITCAGGPEEITTKGVLGTYEGCVDYLGWTDRGVVAARGCNSPEDLKGTDFEEQAYALGKNL